MTAFADFSPPASKPLCGDLEPGGMAFIFPSLLIPRLTLASASSGS